MIVENPIAEPMISKCFFGGPEDLQQYVMEMLDGILDFEIGKGNWKYTYHDRMTNWQNNDLIFGKNGLNQIDFVIHELTRNKDSRRAVIDIRDNWQDAFSDDPACLQHIQFLIRDNKLHMKVLFRSNDICKALFMNAFALIQIQIYIAYKLNVDVGTYTHRSNSMHCYLKDFDLLRGYVDRIGKADMFGNPLDIVYFYKDDWEVMMREAIPDIMKKVESLKKQ